jgi:hypothetical protein
MGNKASIDRWSSEYETRGSDVNGWGIAGIVVGALIVGVILINLPDIRRYQRIRRM